MTFEELVALGGAWAWASYGKELMGAVAKTLALSSGRKINKLAEASWNQLEWQLAAKRYRQKIREQYGTTRILGKPNPVPLEGIFTDVWMLDQPLALTRFDIGKLRADPKVLDTYVTRLNGLELVKQVKDHFPIEEVTGHRLFILGRPGAGKTTFLKYVTIQATNGTLDRIPMFVSIKDWGDSELALIPFLCKQFKICGFADAEPFVEHILEKGYAIVMFDGLDEVTQEGRRRDTLISEIRDFSQQYSEAQCLITCRIAATQYVFDKYEYVEIADFTKEQIITFAEKWFADEPTKLKLFKQEFHSPKNKGLRELGKVPLLLSLLCLSFEETLAFPQRRAEIYEEALDALLKKWDASRSIKRDAEAYHGMNLIRKRHMLSRLATKSFQMNEYFIPQDKLVKHITDYMRILPDVKTDADGEAVLKAIEAQHGILVERAHRIYSFSHLSLQEHLTAKYICDNASREVLSELLRIEHIIDPRWREVILITASLLENADGFFKLFQRFANDLIDNDEILLETVIAFSQVTDNEGLMQRQMIRLLYYTVITRFRNLDIVARSRHGEYSLLDQTFNDASDALAVEFPLPIFTVAHKSGRTRLVNLDHILGLIGPVIPPSINAEFKVDLNLIYMLLVAERLERAEGDSEDVGILNREFIRFFDSVLKEAIPEDDAESIAAWWRIRPGQSQISTCNWTAIIAFLVKYIPRFREDAKESALTPARVNTLKHYIYCSDLLFECLQLGVVTDRGEIERNIYRLPRGFSALRVSS